MASRRSPRSLSGATEPAAPEREAPQAVERVMRTLAREIDGLELPAVEKISESQKQDPFQILISTLLSARTQDATTLAASTRLFAKAHTPEPGARAAPRGGVATRAAGLG